VDFKEGHNELTRVDKVKIVACDAKPSLGSGPSASAKAKE
jgi:hypothetical protein